MSKSYLETFTDFTLSVGHELYIQYTVLVYKFLPKIFKQCIETAIAYERKQFSCSMHQWCETTTGLQANTANAVRKTYRANFIHIN